MKIHEIVNNSTLQIILDPVDDNLLADIEHFEVCVLVLVAITINGRVNPLVHLDPISEVHGCCFWILTLVIGTGQLDVTDVCHDEFLIVTFALDEQDLNPVGSACIKDPFASVLCRIGGVEDANHATRAKPGEHVGDGSLGSSAALALTLLVGNVKEVSSGLGGIMAPIIANIERLGRDRKPL